MIASIQFWMKKQNYVSTISEVEKDGKGMSQEEFNKVLDFWFENPTIANIDFKHYVESYDDWKIEKIRKIVDAHRT